jgi:NADP-dependent 3-hydroxy acid dehydrogenase YdfG
MSSHNNNLRGKVAIVAGASNGIGAANARNSRGDAQ